jgi:hypothetical protein
MKTRALLVLLFGMLAGTVQAGINGKPVILVHGFQMDDLQNIPPNEAYLNQRSIDYFGDFWTQRADDHHYFSSAERVSGGIKNQFKRHFQELENNGKCAQGCIWVTHSTGDLVLRDALSRLGQWGIDQNRVKVLAVIDLAGAGGGTELADLAVTVSQSSGFIQSSIRVVVGLFLGLDVVPENLGVVNDLRPSAARSIAPQNLAFPRLRFVGTGSAFASLTKPFIEGSDDSVVPLHSACGARYVGNYESCSRSIQVNGKLSSSRAPSSLMFNNYVVLMGESADHFEVITDDRAGGNYATVVNDATFNGVRVDFDDVTERKWWSWFTKVRTLRNGDRKSMSRHVYETLDN